MVKKNSVIRYLSLLLVFFIAVFYYGGVLLNMQIARAEEYKRVVQTTYTRVFKVPATRGEIFDRYGVPLVTNKNIYDIVIDGKKMPKKGYVGILIDLVEKIDFYNGELTQNSMPVMAIETESEPGEVRYSYSMKSQDDRYRLDKFLSKNKLNVNTSADELVAFLTLKYNLDEYMPPEERDPKLFRAILGICYEFDRQDVLAGSNTYKICADVNKVLIAVIMENSHNYPGVEVMLRYERVYHIPQSAPHILGTIGKIPGEKLEWYTDSDRGYEMDATVGRGGVEGAFEEYLRGIDGELERTYDQDGNLLDECYIKEPVAGKDVYLTIDIKLQQVAEHSLEKTINRIHDFSKAYPDPKLNGADANAGAAAVIDPNTGEVLAIATYPSYDITDTFNTEKYAELAADKKNSPFLNRATQGEYAPGSVFKIVTSTAALCGGYLSVNETIFDQGKFTKYEGYQPVCWAYPSSHGSINVSQAIQHSCNYFYFTVGDRMGIGPLDACAKRLGMGEFTGIEIGEEKGILASPEYAQSKGEVWSAGQTIAAAIGQSYNVFTPLQMATMLGAVLNGGDRYKNTLLLCVKEYGSDEIYYAPRPEIIDSARIPQTALDAIKQGMLNVTEAGTVAGTLFGGFPRYFVGAKTGTAQVNIGKSSENGTFVAFAPYNNPQVAMSAVIEKGSRGTWAGFVAEDVLAYYFGYKTFAQSMDLPEEPEPEDQDPKEPEQEQQQQTTPTEPPPPVTQPQTNPPPPPQTQAQTAAEEITETETEPPTPAEPETEAPAPAPTEPEPETEPLPPPHAATEEPTIAGEPGH